VKKSISGIRGIFGTDLTLKDVLKFCNNFSSLIENKKCVVGTDTRTSGKIIRDTANAALMQCGVDVYNLGIVPTPVVFREARNYGAGLVITSSHNPLEWNGLKFIINGRGINEKELESVIQTQDTPHSKIGLENNIDSNYIEEAVSYIGKVSNSPKVTVDIGGGAAKNVAPSLLQKLGCDVKVINEELEKSTRGPDPTTNNLSDLISNTGFEDLGFAYDLDADRLVVVVDGKKQTSDVTLGLGVAKAVQMGYKKFVLSIDTSVSIEKFIKENGGEVKKSKVGEANVIDLMLKTKSQAGGEGSSAGFILPEFNFCRDGIFTSGLIVSMEKKSIKEMISLMEKYHQFRDKIEIESSLQEKILDLVENKMEKKYSEISTLDGIKGMINEDSWILVRKSNTENIIRISAESNDFEKTKNILEETKNLVKRCYEQVK